MLYALGSVANAICVPTGYIVGDTNNSYRSVFDLNQGKGLDGNTLFFNVHCTGSGTIGPILPPAGDRGNFINEVRALMADTNPTSGPNDTTHNRLWVLISTMTIGTATSPDLCPRTTFAPGSELVSSLSIYFSGANSVGYSVGTGSTPYYTYSNNQCLTIGVNHQSDFIGTRNSAIVLDPNVSYYQLFDLSGTIVTYAVRYRTDPDLPDPQACMPNYQYLVSPKRFDFGKVDQTVFNNGGERVSSDIEFTIRRARQNVGTCDQEILVPKLTLTVESGPAGYSVAGNRVYLNNGTSLGIYRVAPGTQTEIPFSSGEVVDFGALGGPSSILESTQFVRVKWRGNPGERAVVGSPWSVVMRYLIDIR